MRSGQRDTRSAALAGLRPLANRGRKCKPAMLTALSMMSRRAAERVSNKSRPNRRRVRLRTLFATTSGGVHSMVHKIEDPHDRRSDSWRQYETHVPHHEVS